MGALLVFGANATRVSAFKQQWWQQAAAVAAGSGMPLEPDCLLITTCKDMRQQGNQQQQAAGAS